MTRSVYPYLLVSLGLHLLVLLMLLILTGPQPPEVRQRRVVIEFSRREVHPVPSGEPRPAEILVPQAEPLSGSLDLSGPSTLSAPSGRMPGLPERMPGVPERLPEHSRPTRARGWPGSRIELPAEAEKASVAPEPGFHVSMPDLEDILDDVPSAAAPEAKDVSESREHGTLASGALEWRGRERKVLKSVRPEFPAVLLQEGQEVDVEATFRVAPNGQVTRVDIYRSSGYAVVDRAVEQALLNYLFEPSGVDDEDTGKIRFSYRLERSN
jgi:TonB family protein